MQSILNSIIKGLSVAAGPFGFPAEMYLRYRDECSEEINNTKLEKIISEGHSISREALEEIFEIKNEMTEFRKQLINGIMGIFEVLSETKKLLPNHQMLEIEIPNLISKHQEIFTKSGFITEKTFTAELSELYEDDIDRFRMIISNAGYQLRRIPHGATPDVMIFRFLNDCRGLKIDVQAKIFTELSNDKPANKMLFSFASLLRERAYK